MKHIQEKGQHSPVVQLFLKHLVSSNAPFLFVPPQTLEFGGQQFSVANHNHARRCFPGPIMGEKKIAGGRIFMVSLITCSTLARASSPAPVSCMPCRRSFKLRLFCSVSSILTSSLLTLTRVEKNHDFVSKKSIKSDFFD